MASRSDQRSHYVTYGDFQQDVLARVRQETYGEDIGQFSWLTADELRGFLRRLSLSRDSRVLDVACGSGGPAIFLADSVGCDVIGIDISQSGIDNGNRLAAARGLGDRVRFQQRDAGQRLPFDASSFDAILCVDAINHIYDRLELLREWNRVLCPGGRFLFTDAVIVTGMLRREEIMARSSSMGAFIFTPPGVHERQIQAAGFADLMVEDVTTTIAGVTRKWHDARANHREELLKIEGEAAFDDLQRMLATAHALSSERRLSRFAYSASKPIAR